jgi:D-alanyl-D-alanine carboxypeptidase
MAHRRARGGWPALLVTIALLGGTAAEAQIGGERYAALVVDARGGEALIAANPDERRHPASLTKMMTLYLVFEALRDGRLTLGQRLVMSPEAASNPPSKLGLLPGQSISLEHAILAVVTKSANDVAALLGETLGGSEQRFAQMMTLRARALGMTRTTFRNASGLPDLDQVTTARDMALLGRRLIQDFPDRYHYFGTVHAQVAGARFRNHNRMLGDYDGADGIKTGYIRDSGFNIVTSAVRTDVRGQPVRLIAAVFGGASWVERDQHTAALLDQGFERLGVAPRPAAVASRATPSLLGRAQAATPTRRPTPTRAVAARPPAPRAAAATTAARAPAARPASTTTRTATRTPARTVEQGDGGRSTRPATTVTRRPTTSTTRR